MRTIEIEYQNECWDLILAEDHQVKERLEELNSIEGINFARVVDIHRSEIENKYMVIFIQGYKAIDEYEDESAREFIYLSEKEYNDYLEEWTEQPIKESMKDIFKKENPDFYIEHVEDCKKVEYLSKLCDHEKH